MLGQVFLGWTSIKQGLMCLAQGHNEVTPVRLEPATPVSSQALNQWATALPYLSVDDTSRQRVNRIDAKTNLCWEHQSFCLSVMWGLINILDTGDVLKSRHKLQANSTDTHQNAVWPHQTAFNVGRLHLITGSTLFAYLTMSNILLIPVLITVI